MCMYTYDDCSIIKTNIEFVFIVIIWWLSSVFNGETASL